MNRLVSSPLALVIVVALDQCPQGLRLVELSQAADTGPSAAQRAIEILMSDGFLERGPAPRPRSRLRAGHPASAALVTLARSGLPIGRALDAVCRANPAVAFAAKDQGGWVIVIRRFAEPDDEAHLLDSLRGINGGRDDPRVTEVYRQDQFRELVASSQSFRNRLTRLTVLQGTVDRFLPRPPRRNGLGERVGHLPSSLRKPSTRAIEALAKRHGLARVVVFGSAVRTDFGPGSDVDVLVEARPDVRLGLDDVIQVRERLERAFDRDVDVVNARFARPGLLRAAAAEGVVLYG
jgi:predicted nucleotidyltransferase